LRIISKKKLRDFWARHPEAESALKAWHQRVRHSEWKKFADVKGSYASADLVGKFIVFNIGGNKFRLIAAIHYNRGIVFVRRVMTHPEYDRGRWKSD